MAHTREQKPMNPEEFTALFNEKLKLLSDLGETFRKIEPFFMTITWEPRTLGILFKALEDNFKKGFDRQGVMKALDATKMSPREILEITCRPHPQREERKTVYKNDADIRNAKAAITDFLLTLNRDAEMLNFAHLYFKRQREFYQGPEHNGTNDPQDYRYHDAAGAELNQILKTNKVTHICTYADKSAHTFDRFVRDNRPLTSDLVDELALDFFAGREMKESGDLIPSLKKATKEIVECYVRHINLQKEKAKQPAPVPAKQPIPTPSPVAAYQPSASCGERKRDFPATSLSESELFKQQFRALPRSMVPTIEEDQYSDVGDDDATQEPVSWHVDDDALVSPETGASQAVILQQLSREKQKEKEKPLVSALAQPSSSSRSRERKEVSFGRASEISPVIDTSISRELPAVQPDFDSSALQNLLALVKKAADPKQKLTPREIIMMEEMQNVYASLSSVKHRHSS